MKDFNKIFRPTIWNEVLGQDKIISILNKQVTTKNGLSSGYIFSGKSGIGKTTIARLFFKALNCSNLLELGDPCNECDSCKNFDFELMEVNASDQRGIDDMRNITNYMRLAPIGNCKGVLLDEVHMLSKPAWNCLLKPIEDASDKSVWLLCTTELHKIPKTIQTRCQIYKLNPIRWSDVFKRLKMLVDDTKIGISDEELWIIARNCDNNLRQAIHLLEQYSVVGDLEKIINEELNVDFLTSLATNDYKTMWKVFMSWNKKYSDIDSFLNAIKWDLSVCLKLKLGIKVEEINQYKLNKYKELSSKLDEHRILYAIDIVLDFQQRVSGIWDYNSLFLKSLCQLKNI